MQRRGPLYTDSDVYKWLEAVAFLVQSKPDSPVRKSAEAVIDEIAAAQEPSGYINTFYSRENRDQRHKNMRHAHELYCLGHLIQAGIAWQRATGESKLLGIGRRMADYVASNFGPGKTPAFEGHPEIELALIELSRATRDKKYLEMAGYFLGGDPRNLSGIPPRDLVHAASKIPAAGTGSDLYQAFLRRPAGGESAIVTLIPYYTFHNRDITSMQVWVPYRQ